MFPPLRGETQETLGRETEPTMTPLVKMQTVRCCPAYTLHPAPSPLRPPRSSQDNNRLSPHPSKLPDGAAERKESPSKATGSVEAGWRDGAGLVEAEAGRRF